MLSDHQDKQKQKHGSRGQWGEPVHGHQTPMLLDSAVAPGIASYVEVEDWAAAILLLWPGAFLRACYCLLQAREAELCGTLITSLVDRPASPAGSHFSVS